jgi:hypothetical protein
MPVDLPTTVARTDSAVFDSPSARDIALSLSSARRRILLCAFLREYAVAQAVLDIALVVAAVASPAFDRERHRLVVVGALIFAPALFALARCAAVRVPESMLARLIDARGNLSDRVSTAVEFAGKSNRFADLLKTDASIAVARFDLRRALSLRQFVVFAALVFVLTLFLCVWRAPESISKLFVGRDSSSTGYNLGWQRGVPLNPEQARPRQGAQQNTPSGSQSRKTAQPSAQPVASSPPDQSRSSADESRSGAQQDSSQSGSAGSQSGNSGTGSNSGSNAGGGAGDRGAGPGGSPGAGGPTRAAPAAGARAPGSGESRGGSDSGPGQRPSSGPAGQSTGGARQGGSNQSGGAQNSAGSSARPGQSGRSGRPDGVSSRSGGAGGGSQGANRQGGPGAGAGSTAGGGAASTGSREGEGTPDSPGGSPGSPGGEQGAGGRAPQIHPITLPDVPNRSSYSFRLPKPTAGGREETATDHASASKPGSAGMATSSVPYGSESVSGGGVSVRQVEQDPKIPAGYRLLVKRYFGAGAVKQ